MQRDTLYTAPHCRLNLLTDEWVLVSPHRTQRPWQGQVELPPVDAAPDYDPHCYLCPGNERAGGARNPQYTETFVFDNDFAALLPDITMQHIDQEGLLVARSERGICRVVCFAPQHNLTLASMEPAAIRRVVDVWADQYAQLGAIPWVRHVQIFENRGAMMGASNPHPHGQIWVNEHLPNEAVKELRTQRAYLEQHGRHLLADYLARELQAGERVVCQNAHFVVVVPFWAVWPFETLLLPRMYCGALSDLESDARDSLATILRDLTRRYNRLFNVMFPYSMGFHQRPTDSADYPTRGGTQDVAFLLHAHFYPPLLRSATVRKFMVGYEMLAQPQRDITPELAAARLRDVGD